MCFHDRQNGMATICCVAIATQIVRAMDGIDCPFFPSVACLELSNCSNLVIFFICYWSILVALPCSILLVHLHNWKGMIIQIEFCCDGPSHFESVAMATWLDVAMIFVIFCEALLVLIQVIYLWCLCFWLERQDNWITNKIHGSDDHFWIWPRSIYLENECHIRCL